jgi:hypothetical protein
VIRIGERGRNRQRTCELNGTPVEDSYTLPSGEWTAVSECRWLGNALVIEETHRNAATRQSWRILLAYSLDAQTRDLVVTTVGASKAMGPYMATSTRIYRRDSG